MRASIEEGARTRQEVTAACGAGDGCGGCHRTIKSMIVECRRAETAACRATISTFVEQAASSAVA